MFNNSTKVSPFLFLNIVATLVMTIGLIQTARSISAQANLSQCIAQDIVSCEPKASF
jgi:hypothetical protein